MATKGANPNYAVHPGRMLDEWLDENAMSQGQIAARLGRSTKNINQVVNGVAGISPDLALALETVTGVPSRLWTNMQAQYDADVARLRQAESLRHATGWLDNLPLSDLKKRGHITASGRDKLTQALECLRFFGVSSVDAWDAVWAEPQAQYRQSTAYTAKAAAVATWLRIGEIESQQCDVLQYDRGQLEGFLPEMRALSREPNGSVIVPRLVEMASKSGVVLLFIPDVSGTRLYGATRWQRQHPVVQLSLRRKSDDQFWFSLFHELAHVLLHGRDRIFVDGSDVHDTTEEAEADRFASDLLIPPMAASRLRAIRSLGDVREFAAEIGVSPGVVVGRMHHDGTRHYSWGAGLKRTVAFVEAA